MLNAEFRIEKSERDASDRGQSVKRQIAIKAGPLAANERRPPTQRSKSKGQAEQT